MNGYSVKRSKREMIEDLPEEHVRADKIGHSTLEYTTPDGRRIIRFHHTNVVTFHPNGDVTLDSGGHQSNTTKKRFNEHAPVTVGQADWTWFVHTPVGTFPFYDGFTVDSLGKPTSQTYGQLVANGALSLDELLRVDAYAEAVRTAQSVPEIIHALAVWSDEDFASYKRSLEQVRARSTPKRLPQGEWRAAEEAAEDPQHPDYQEARRFAADAKTALFNLRPHVMDMLVVMVLTGLLTRAQLMTLPPEIQVRLDAALEEIA